MSAAAKGHPMGLYYAAVFIVMHAQPLPEDPGADDKVALLGVNGAINRESVCARFLKTERQSSNVSRSSCMLHLLQ